jgi:hypothetical protein
VAGRAGRDPGVAGADGARDHAVAGGAELRAEGDEHGRDGRGQRAAAADAAFRGSPQGGGRAVRAPRRPQLRLPIPHGDDDLSSPSAGNANGTVNHASRPVRSTTLCCAVLLGC